VSLERLWAGWRSEYVGSMGAEVPDDCVLCRVLDDGSQVVWTDGRTAAILNAFPYTSGHLMVLPVTHVAEPHEVDGAAFWQTVTDAVAALRRAYNPDGLNFGANLGRAAGAGVPGHFHVHVLPRWNGDTNFMTTVAEARVLPESLPATAEKVRAAWPSS
jgi:diadenosine tetraphosphate (Ap4A) HIT family hydrolase